MTAQINAQPAALDILLTRANDFSASFQFNDALGHPLTTWAGYTIASTLRRYADDPDAVEFDVDDSSAATGLWTISLPADVAEGLSSLVQYAWDLLRVDDAGKVKTLLAGSCSVKPNITDAP